MIINILYFDGCPSWEDGVRNLEAALAAENLEAIINLVKVNNDKEAESLKFLGSPSFVIEGEDLWPEMRSSYSLSCRVYSTPQGMKGAPTVEMLRDKLAAIKNHHKTR